MYNRRSSKPHEFNLPPVGVETHAHLDFPEFAKDLDQVLQCAAQAGIARIGNIFLSASAYRTHAPLLSQKTQLFFTLGVHPHEAVTVNADVLADLEQLFRRDGRLLAVGEIGLDFYWNRSPRDIQIKAFREQLALARDLSLPAVIHSRQAEEETLSILQDLGFRGRPLLWHCFGGGPDLAASILARGWHISIPGPVTFPKNTDLHKAVSEIPLSRMVLETDCPFLAPHPFRGKRNEPALMVYTAAKIAELKEEDLEMVWTECAATARNFFSLPSS